MLVELFAGYAQPVRAKLDELHILQSFQLARLCDIKGQLTHKLILITPLKFKIINLVLADPNVEVVYVSPRPVDQEVLDYYHKLLAMRHQVSGASGEEFHQRIHIVTPEYAGSFSHHNFSLSTELLYSPQALQRIQRLTAGREAYIVPGVVNRDDIAMADKLGEPGSYMYIIILYRKHRNIAGTFKFGDLVIEHKIVKLKPPIFWRTCTTSLRLDTQLPN